MDSDSLNISFLVAIISPLMKKDTLYEKSLLVIVASPDLGPSEVALVREMASVEADIVAWQHLSIVQERFPSPDVAAYLRALNIPALSLTEALGEKLSVEVDEAVIAWMKAFGRTPLDALGKSFRSLFKYRHLSLWWWAEIFLYHDTPLRLLVRDVEALSRLLDRRRPDRVFLVSPVRGLAAAARHLAPGEGPRGSPRRRVPRRAPAPPGNRGH